MLPLLAGPKTCEYLHSGFPLSHIACPVDSITVRGVLVFSKLSLERAVELAAEFDIHPHVGEVYAWEDAAKSLERLRSQDFVGKIVIWT